MGETPPSIVVFTPQGMEAHYGSITIDSRMYPIDRESALSHLFFKVTDAVGNIDPKTGQPTRSERFYADPGTYFDAIYPRRAGHDDGNADGDGDADDADMKGDYTRQRRAARERFLAEHAAFYDRRAHVMADPGGYIKWRQEQAHMCSRRMSATLAQSMA